MDRSNADVTFLNSGYITLWFLILFDNSSTHPIISIATGVASGLLCQRNGYRQSLPASFYGAEVMR
jgi:hypothetical protein